MDPANNPLSTFYTITSSGVVPGKCPKYHFKSASQEKDYQSSLGDFLGFYYGVTCNTCCGVYPLFCSDDTFKSLCFYMCLVCGRESFHFSMPYQAVSAWNNCQFLYDPDDYRQLTIFDYINPVKGGR